MTRLEELQEENNRLRRSVGELSMLADIATATSQEQSVQAVIELIVHKAVRALGVEQGAIYLLTEDETRLTFQTLWRDARSSTVYRTFHMSDQLVGWMLKHQRVLEVNDVAEDGRFDGVTLGDTPVRSMLCAPCVKWYSLPSTSRRRNTRPGTPSTLIGLSNLPAPPGLK